VQISYMSEERQAPDEHMFVTWALLSRQSLCLRDYTELERYLTSEAMHWYQLLRLDILIAERDDKNIAQLGMSLFPLVERSTILMQAMGLHSPEEEKELLHCATSSLNAILSRLCSYTKKLNDGTLELEWVREEAGRLQL
jgi:hypothetical protein